MNSLWNSNGVYSSFRKSGYVWLVSLFDYEWSDGYF